MEDDLDPQKKLELQKEIDDLLRRADELNQNGDMYR